MQDVPTGEIPRSFLLVVDRSLVQRVSPGTRVTVFGILSIYQSSDKGKTKGAAAIRQPYLRVVGLEFAAEGNARAQSITFTADEVSRIKRV